MYNLNIIQYSQICAHNIIPQQVVALADMRCTLINVICDDKVVFVIISYFFVEENI